MERYLLRLVRGLLPCVALASACAEVVQPADGPVESITVEPAEPLLEEGQQQQLIARLYNSAGQELEGRTVFWATEDSTVAVLAENGLLRAVSRGTTRVAASSEGKHALAQVQVLPVAVGSVSVTAVTLAIGEKRQLEAVVRDRNGVVVTDREVTWSSSAATVASVDASGVVTGISPGPVVITATSEGVAGTANLVVRPGPPSALSIVSGNAQEAEVGAQLANPLVVRVTDPEGNAVPGVTVQWSATHGSVSAASGTTDAGGEASATWTLGSSAGDQTATATAGGLSAEFSASAKPRPAGRVDVSPTTLSLAVQASAQLEAIVRDQNGNVLAGRAVSWSSSAPTIAQVNGTGMVVALKPGSATISATSEGVQGKSEVTVTSGPPAAISIVSGNAQHAQIGAPLANPLVIRLNDALGNPVRNVAVQWSAAQGSITPTENTTAADGQASASWTLGSTPGTQRATATAGSLSVQFSATAGLIAVGSVDVSPATVSIPVQGTQQMQAAVRAADGAALTDRPVTWSTTTSSIAQVSESGIVTGVSPGSATVKATAGGVDGSAAVVVTAGAPAAISVISGNGQQAAPGSALPDPLVVEVTDAGDNPVPGVTVQWSAAQGSVAPVSGTTGSNGRASTSWTLGGAQGQQQATATAGSLSVQFSATSGLTPVGSVEVSPSAVSLPVQGTQQLEVVVRDAGGAILTDRPVTWSSSASSIAQVSESGVVSAISPGSATIKATSGGVDGSTAVEVTAGAPAAISVVSGNEQEAATGSALPAPLVVRVTDASDNPVANVNVAWSAAQGSVSPASGTTGSDGQVSTSWTLGSSAGAQQATATAGTLTVNFSATATAPSVGQVTVSPALQILAVNQTHQMQATVRDTDGNQLPDHPVTWSSSASGVAQVDETGLVTAKGVGVATITASAGGKQGSASITVIPGLGSSISVVSGNGQQGVKNTTLPEPLVVRVTDLLGNGVPSVTVQWSVNRGGSVSPATTVTNASGETSTSWTLGSPVGEHTATATAGSLSVGFSATSLPEPQAAEGEAEQST